MQRDATTLQHNMQHKAHERITKHNEGRRRKQIHYKTQTLNATTTATTEQQ